MAPQSSKNVLSVKDNILKIDLSDNYHHYRPISPSNTLYKKAQIEVLNHKKKPETTKQEVEKPRKQDSLVTLTVLSPTEREDNPKECVKNLHSINSYVSPSALTTIHSSQSKLSKKSSLKTTFVVSPSEKKKEKPVYVFHELSKDAVYKKTPFKLNLSKRNQDNR